MPVALIVALAASLGIHALALFGPEFELPMANESAPLIAELKQPTPPPAVAEFSPPAREPSPAFTRSKRPSPRLARARPPRARAAESAAAATAVAAHAQAVSDALPGAGGRVGEGTAHDAPAVPGAGEVQTGQESGAEVAGAPPSLLDEPAPTRLPMAPKGTIRYRVERGDPGLWIGEAVHAWEIADGAYRITAITETVGLVAWLRPLRVLAESRGRVIAAGLLPQSFVTRRDGRESNEEAEFDWHAMELRMPGRPVHSLLAGTQDVLSFHYQLALAGEHASGSRWAIATGRKYVTYAVELVSDDEEVRTPVGVLRCRHLRVPGTTTTDVWLSQEYALLPVKIAHRDRKGDLFVQVATSIDILELAP